MKKCFTSYQELEALGTALAREYTAGTGRWDASCFDIEGFIQDYLGLGIRYETFAGADPGKIGFLSDGITPLAVRRNGCVCRTVFPKDTVVVEKYLLRPEESARRRFTLAHEAGHAVKNRHSPLKAAPCFHSDYDGETDMPIGELRRLLSAEESLVSRLGASILMPDFLVARALETYHGARKLTCYAGGIFAEEDKLAAQKMADSLGVSYSALINRLRELEFLDVRPFSEYSRNRLGFGRGILQ